MKPIAASTPRYLVLAEALRARIEGGVLKPGDRLPSEAQLCATSGVSRGTVVRAIEQLVSQGFVTRRQGAGSFVANRSLHRKAGHLLSFSQTARQDGHSSQQRLLAFRNADDAEAQQFGVAAPAYRLERVRLIDGEPCAVHGSVIPAAVCERIGLAGDGAAALLKDPDFSLYARFEAAGLAVREARERVTARLATAAECAVLAVTAPSPVMVVFRTSYAADNLLVEAVEAVYRADFYTYDTHLVRGERHAGSGLRIVAAGADF
ncbi:MAG: GntR family transcriptional regulator [Nitratireductor sp.]